MRKRKAKKKGNQRKRVKEKEIIKERMNEDNDV